MNTTTSDRLESIRDNVKPTPAEKTWRDGIIAREVKAATTDKARLAELTGLGIPQINRIARTVTPAPAEDIVDAEMSRAVNDDLADIFGGGEKAGRALVVKSTRKAKAPKAVHVETEGLTLHVVDATKPKAARKPLTPVVDAKPSKGGFAPAPAGGHVPPRARKVRSTGSVIEFGHAADMGLAVDDAAPWVARCLTHSASSTWPTRGAARYQDGTEFCLDCAAIATA